MGIKSYFMKHKTFPQSGLIVIVIQEHNIRNTADTYYFASPISALYFLYEYGAKNQN